MHSQKYYQAEQTGNTTKIDKVKRENFIDMVRSGYVMIKRNKTFLIILIAGLLLVVSLLFDTAIVVKVSKIRTDFITNSSRTLTSWLFGIFIFCLFLIPSIKKGYKIVMLLILSELIIFAISMGLKQLINRSRPYEKAPGILIIKDTTPSFPSHHASASFLWSFFMADLFPQYSPVFYIFAICYALMRLYTGVHYLSDLIGGFLLAYILYLLVRKELLRDLQ